MDPKKTYAAAVRTLRQRVTGRSNDTGTARKPVATTEIKGVLTTAINQQKVIQSMLAVLQSREQRCYALTLPLGRGSQLGLGPRDNGQERSGLPDPGSGPKDKIRYGTIMISYGLPMEKYGPRSDLGQKD